MKITNRSDYGDLDVALLRRVVPAGETVDVTEDQARRLLPQTANWAPADDDTQALLDELAAAAVPPAVEETPDQAILDPTAVVVPQPQPAGIEPANIAPPLQPGEIEPAHIAPPPAPEASPELNPTPPPADPLQPENVAPAQIGIPEAPAASALKGEWVTYAQALGLDPTGQTKQQLINLTSAQPASDTTEA